MNKLDQHSVFMRQAIDLSINKMLAGDGGPFGAVIVKDGKIISRGWNQVSSLNDPTAHAEMTAIRAACQHVGHFELTGCVLYTSCEPCPMCMGGVYWSGITTLYYASTKNDASAIGFDDRFIYEEFEKPIADRKLRAVQLMREEALQAFNLWQKKQDKIPY